MKKFILVAMAVCVLLPSCKNNKAKKAEQEAAAQQEYIEVSKSILSEEVLTTMDEIAANLCQVANNQTYSSFPYELTAKEKRIKPKGLYNPADAANLMTKNQKVNVLPVLMQERMVRKSYDMDVTEAEAAIAKLQIDLGIEQAYNNTEEETIGQIYSKMYNIYKENGESQYFWQFQYAAITETLWIISQNTEIAFKNLTQEAWDNFYLRAIEVFAGIHELAEYDPEIAEIEKTMLEYPICENNEMFIDNYATVERAKESLAANQVAFAARRAIMLEEAVPAQFK